MKKKLLLMKVHIYITEYKVNKIELKLRLTIRKYNKKIQVNK